MSEFQQGVLKDPSDVHSPVLYELCWEQDKPGFGTACDRMGGHKGLHSWQTPPAVVDETPKIMRLLIESLRETKKRDDERIARVRAYHEEHEGRCLRCLEPCFCFDEAEDTPEGLWKAWNETCAHGNEPYPCPTIRALDGEQPRHETHVLIDRATIECVLSDHVYELNDDHGKVDPNLAELAYVYRELTGYDAVGIHKAAAEFSARRAQAWRDDPANQVVDDDGTVWIKCSPGCDLHLVRPGKVQCNCQERP